MRWHGPAAWVGSRLMKLLGGTLKWAVVDEAGYLGLEPGSPVLAAVWHNRILALPLCYQWFCRGRRPLTVLTSASRDGGLLTAIVAQFRIGAVRGSSSRRGLAAIREMKALLSRGQDIVITPDGPRGPRYKVNSGVVFLAQHSGVPIMGIRVEYSSYWELRSWDRFQIPKPFSKVTVRFMPLHRVESGGGEVEFEGERRRVEELLG